MEGITTIRVDKKTRERLEDQKIIEREPMVDLINRLLDAVEAMQKTQVSNDRTNRQSLERISKNTRDFR